MQILKNNIKQLKDHKYIILLNNNRLIHKEEEMHLSNLKNCILDSQVMKINNI